MPGSLAAPARAPIKLLPAELRNQIAAGEVVDRPAGIIKELVENSLDAGASRIDVSLEQGGLAGLTVRDNGRGIPAAELELAVSSHATSKLRTLADLMAIHTLGFRGEALPSIGSVSILRVTSVFSPEQGAEDALTPEAAFIELRFGEVSARGGAALDQGTLVEVRELFANIPARLKFLKTPTTELKRCRETLERLALNYLDAGFRLYSEGREICNFSAGQTLTQRLAAIWPPDIVEAMQPVQFARDGINVRGVAGDPAMAQPKSDRLFFYVNGRPVQDRILPAAVRQAYKGRLVGKECPQAVIFVDLPPEEVDVNVHPAKAEVRFRDERAVFGAVLKGVERAVEQFSHRLTGFEQESFAGTEAYRRPGFWGLADSRTGVWPLGKKSAPEPEPETFVFLGSDRRSAVAAGTKSNGGNLLTEQDFQTAGPRGGGGLAESCNGYGLEDPDSESLSVGGFPPLAREACDAAEAAHIAEVASGPELVYLGQIGETYLAAALNRDNLLVLDQHAVHEAVLYARLRERGLAGESRPLALPLSVSLHSSEIEQLEAQWTHFAALGFKLSRTEEFAVRIEGVPPDLSAGEAREFLQEVLSGRVEGLEDLWAMMACKAAIKAKAALTGDEARELLRQWAENAAARYCPHGRPTAVVLSRADLEKLFKRRR